jgi:hypothetical protein
MYLRHYIIFCSISSKQNLFTSRDKTYLTTPAEVFEEENWGRGTKVRVCDYSISENLLLFPDLQQTHFHRVRSQTPHQ